MPPPRIDLTARHGTARYPSEEAAARFGQLLIDTRRAAPLDGTADVAALGRRCAVLLRAVVGLRRVDLALLRLQNIGGLDGTDELWLLAQTKGMGDTSYRLEHIALVGETAAVTRAYVRARLAAEAPRAYVRARPAPKAPRAHIRARPATPDALFPSWIIKWVTGAIPHAVRDIASTVALDLSPHDWIAAQHQLGHAIPTHPAGRDGEFTYAAAPGVARRVAGRVLAIVTERSYRAAGPPRQPDPRPAPADRPLDHRPTRIARTAGPLAACAGAYAARYGGDRLHALVADRLRRTRHWPQAEEARRRRLLAWYRDAIIAEGDRSGAASRAVIQNVSGVLAEAGLLAQPPEITIRDYRTLCSPLVHLTGERDPTGSALYRRLAARVVEALRTPAGVPDLRPTVGLLLLFTAAWPTALEDLASLRWADIGWDRRIVCLVPEGDGRSPVYLPLTPIAECALYLLRRRTAAQATYVFGQPGQDAPSAAKQLLHAALREHDAVQGRPLSPQRLAAMASRFRRAHMPGYVVDTVVDRREPYRPIDGGDSRPLQAYVERRFAAHAPPTDERIAARPAAHRGPFRAMEDADRWVAEARRALASRRSVADAPRALEAVAADAARAVGWMGEDLLADLPALFAQASPPQVELLNVVCAIRLLAHRAGRARMPHDVTGRRRAQDVEWWRTTTEAAAGVRLQPSTQRSYLSSLVAIIRHLGPVPLIEWSDGEWAALETAPRAAATIKHYRTMLRQLRHFIRVCLDVDVASAWTIARAEPLPAPHPLPSPGLLAALFDALAADADDGGDLVLYAGAMLRYGLRPVEAAALLAREVGLEGCYVDARSTKTKSARLAPEGYAPRCVERAIARRLADVFGGGNEPDDSAGRVPERQEHGREPFFVPAGADPRRMVAVRQRLAAIMARFGLTPYALRHTYVTLRIAAVVAYRAAPEASWPGWVERAARDLDPLRATALAVGHSTSQHTRQVYDHSTLWRAALCAEAYDLRLAHELGGTAVPARAVAAALRMSPANLRMLAADHALSTNALRLPGILTLVRALSGRRGKARP